MSGSGKVLYSSSITSMNSIYNTYSSEFFDSIKNNNKSALLKIIRNPDYKFWNFVEEGNNNGLHVSAMRELTHLVKLMFKEIEEKYPKEAKSILSNWINQANDKGDLPVHYFSYKGNMEVIKLFEGYNMQVNVRNKQGNTIMHNSAQGNQPAVFIYFHHKYNLKCYETNNDGCTPLHWACYTGSELALMYILKYIDDVNVQDNDGLTPLHLAVMSERTGIIKKLLHKGARRDLKDKKGRTPKQLAEEKGKNLISDMLEEQITCSLLIIKNPLKRIEKSRFNIWVYLLLNFYCLLMFIGFVLPGKV
jgi:palmitoyltransferase ZDHHC13/17